jgi:hypothetical protein
MTRVVNNPILNDFVYTLLYGASYEEKRGLKGKYLRAAMNGKAAKHFATNSSREEKEYVLAHFGVEFFYVVVKRDVTMARMKEIFALYESGKKAKALREMAEAGIFISSDKEFTRLLGHMSQSIHNHSFFLNLEFIRQGYHIQKWKKHNLNGLDATSREIDETSKVLAKTMLKASIAMDFVQGSTGVTPTQMKILLLLYSISHAYIKDDDLYGHFVGAFNKTKYRWAMKALVKEGLILPQGPLSKREVTITGAGIKHVNNFFNSVINQ